MRDPLDILNNYSESGKKKKKKKILKAFED